MRLNVPANALRLTAALALGLALGACNGPSNSRNSGGPAGTPTVRPTDIPWTPEIVNYPPVPMGQRSVQRGIGVVLLRIEALSKAGEFSPGTGLTYLSAEVELENTDMDEFPFAFWNFSVEDDQGKVYGAVRITPTSAPAPAISQGTLARGAKVRGNVLFEVPASLTSGTLVYRYEFPQIGGFITQRSAWRR